ncbi:similar to Saccharomyces cerevisiae YDR088C SLU7 RNA splicing factor, required for ATP- independent portion of 2nd catalytic step of spliceosomal RNA splicing [Maudiozyma barnettii]|uniref:Pre-mRNA-splicing factor SLU7 n=1 Tax=Maudiozyma barnettii TaxID=61262 RepID=A0A8H2ZIB5_9SACH|nr:mRNA splicing protein SLU7 [Kazachstania barnettii]CAB4255728.1 similar to Saccharomyces cerevisiae YDR088C SLU7 RNA splicing factor, required for ATP- independent portion of 2nd catalytic step of spliceosomal RNA splicing [Kazachstania barnettii]CAD1784289.1 similar to Saccharomyces cerevisiae YDR088C SLU7 RNA splicing factor, required for ATP- independent portion of 2nd catalytic step of spliceosomal RNA splicing [Kazachstania barnettii]
MVKTNDKNAKKENEHLPRYIKNKPWYNDTDKSDDYLSHHRQSQKEGNLLDIENNNEAKYGLGIHDTFMPNNKVMSNERKKGKPTCTNCGSFDHTKKDCMERPRKVQQTKSIPNYIPTNGNVMNDKEMDWDARKDRWFGYSGKEYNDTLAKWEQNKSRQGNINNQRDTNEEYDTDEEVELAKLQLGNYKSTKEDQNKEKGSTAIRIREDKAAYLNDLNSETTNYDPKSRLYKNDNLGSIDEKSKMFRRHLTGEGLEFDELNQMARSNARKEGIRDEVKNVKKIEHVLIANPTKYEQMMKNEKSQIMNETNTTPNKPNFIKGEAKKNKGKKQNKNSRDQLRSMYK